MPRAPARPQWRRRIVALAAAYVIALAGLISGFAAAYAASGAAPVGILCHSGAPDASGSAPGNAGGPLCLGSCCVGCLMLMAPLPPPTAVAAAPSASGRPIARLESFDIARAAVPCSHRSRAPPHGA